MENQYSPELHAQSPKLGTPARRIVREKVWEEVDDGHTCTNRMRAFLHARIKSSSKVASGKLLSAARSR